jgi:hypothetical protein
MCAWLEKCILAQEMTTGLFRSLASELCDPGPSIARVTGLLDTSSTQDIALWFRCREEDQE